jgi:N-acetylglutamate synthase-like GNAT family acetyltransferase
MSHQALSPQQFPRTGDVTEPDVYAHVHEFKPGEYYLRNLSVNPDKRGGGIGTKFMHGVLAEHDKAGTSVTLHTARPALVKWYGGMGFKAEEDDMFGTRMRREPQRPE